MLRFSNMSFLFYILLLVVCTCEGQVQTVNGTIRIQVGGTAGSQEVANFVAQTLAPVYEKYKTFLEIEYVPWGNTRRVNNELQCEFGVQDCWANRLHRCVLDQIKAEKDRVMAYMLCEFSANRPGFGGTYYCANQAGLNLVTVDYCMISTSGTALEVAAETAAAEPMQVIGSIPYVTFNGVVDKVASDQALQRLDSVICFALADDTTTGITSCKI